MRWFLSGTINSASSYLGINQFGPATSGEPDWCLQFGPRGCFSVGFGPHLGLSVRILGRIIALSNVLAVDRHPGVRIAVLPGAVYGGLCGLYSAILPGDSIVGSPDSSDPTDPWGTPLPFGPGWAHEVWQDTQGSWYSSYLTDLTVTITPLTWDTFFSPPHPRIGSAVYHQLFPLVLYSE